MTAAITGQRIHLAPLDETAIDRGYGEWMQDPEIVRFLEVRFADTSRDALRAFIADTNAAADRHLFGILQRDSARYIGNIKLTVDPYHRRAEIGLLIGDRAAHGHGYGSEAIALVSQYAFEHLGTVKLSAGCYGDNVASIRAFQKAGFEIEAVRPGHYVSGETRVDGVYLALWAPDRPGTAG